MSNEIILLSETAAIIAFIHTILGPDHYLPFILMARAGRWSTQKTLWVTLLCGIGHVFSSVFLGLIGVALGTALFKLEWIESFRGDITAWLLIIFGFTYLVWGLHRAIRNRPHTHLHSHENGRLHIHDHHHQRDYRHVHAETSNPTLTPWILFTIFVLGPCEPLIPLIMYPAAKQSLACMALVTGIFAMATIGSMLVIVGSSLLGLSKISLGSMERFAHALAGLTILLCGSGVKFLGL